MEPDSTQTEGNSACPGYRVRQQWDALDWEAQWQLQDRFEKALARKVLGNAFQSQEDK